MLYAGQSGKLFVVKLLKSRQIAGNGVQQIVGVAKQPLRLSDLGNVQHGIFEGFSRRAIAFPQSDKHQRGKAKAKAAQIAPERAPGDGRGKRCALSGQSIR